MNHFEHEARTPGIWGMKKRLPKNGTIGGPKICLLKNHKCTKIWQIPTIFFSGKMMLHDFYSFCKIDLIQMRKVGILPGGNKLGFLKHQKMKQIVTKYNKISSHILPKISLIFLQLCLTHIQCILSKTEHTDKVKDNNSTLSFISR